MVSFHHDAGGYYRPIQSIVSASADVHRDLQAEPASLNMDKEVKGLVASLLFSC